jgi:hypothetical protein
MSWKAETFTLRVKLFASSLFPEFRAVLLQSENIIYQGKFLPMWIFNVAGIKNKVTTSITIDIKSTAWLFITEI